MIGWHKRIGKVLYVHAHGAIAIGRRGAEWAPEASFTTPDARDDSGIADPDALESAFDEWAIARRRERIALLVDAIDEQCVIETLPNVGLRDRGALVRRRIAQRFRDADFSTWYLSRDEPRNRRTPGRSVALLALQAHALLAPWIASLSARRVRIERLTTPSLLAPAASPGKHRAGQELIVSLTPAGLRQTFVADGLPSFTRLTARADSVQEVIDEITRTMQYLAMSQRIAREPLAAPVRVSIAGSELSAREGWPVSIPLDGTSHADVRMVEASASSLGFWAARASSARGRGFADMDLVHTARVSDARTLAWTSACLCAACGLVVASAAQFTQRELQMEAALIERRTMAQGTELERLRRAVDRLPANAAEMTAVVAMARQADRERVDGHALLTTVARALAGDEAIRVLGLEWAPVVDPEATGIVRAREPVVAAAPDLDIDGSGKPLEPLDGAVSGGLEAIAVVQRDALRVVLNGEVWGAVGKADANARVQALADRLAREAGSDILEIVLPWSLSPDTGLSASTSDPTVRRPSFRIAVGWRTR